MQSVHPKLFPMYLVKVADVLEMHGAPEPHDVVKQKGLLHQWQPGMFTIFLSHQWLGLAHPDASGRQFQVFRQLLQTIIDGNLQVETDMVSQMQGGRVINVSTLEKRQQLAEGYVFFDWFAIPQITARAKGLNEDLTRSDAAKAVQSIPFYVEVSNFFVALVPEATHESGAYCNYTTWLSRGWCRAELWCHLLSQKPDTGVILAHSCKEVKLMFPLDWQENAIMDGDFTVAEDRDVVVQLGQKAVRSKIHHLSSFGPLWRYRFYLARQRKLLGEATDVCWDISSFLTCFRYDSIDACVQCTSRMNAMLCATLAGDVGILRILAEHRADVNFRTKDLAELGYFDGQTLLMVAGKTRQRAEVLSTLVELRADINAVSPNGASVPHFVRTPEQLQFVLDAKGDLHSMRPPICLPVLAAGAAMGSAELVRAMLKARSEVNPSREGIGHSPLHHAVLFARGNPSALANVKLLIEHRANVNAEAEQSGQLWWLSRAAQGYVALMGEARSPMSYRAFAYMAKATPLSEVAWTGDTQLVKLLLEASADLKPNEFGYTPEDMARSNGHFHLLPFLSVFSV